MTQFKIAIVSDVVCPWCYVGKNRLDRAISRHKSSTSGRDDTFTITWLPYYLNRDAPKVGVDKLTYYNSRFGEERSAIMFQRLAGIGKEVGINFKFGGKTGNTRHSHRLIQLAKTKDEAAQTRIVEELFKAYFEEEQDITSYDVLEAAGVKAGLAEGEVKEWLAADRGGKEVDQEIAQAQAKGIRGVPNFTLQGRYEIGGAQDEEAFLEAFEKIKRLEAVVP